MLGSQYALRLISISLSIPLFCGCGGGETIPELIPVEGVITINGSPAPEIRVTFQPSGNKDLGVSIGTTDQSGKYTLQYKGEHEGAPESSYRVSVQQMNEADIPDDQLLPPNFNTQTNLTADVSSSTKTHNFDLEISKR